MLYYSDWYPDGRPWYNGYGYSLIDTAVNSAPTFFYDQLSEYRCQDGDGRDGPGLPRPPAFFFAAGGAFFSSFAPAAPDWRPSMLRTSCWRDVLPSVSNRDFQRGSSEYNLFERSGRCWRSSGIARG